MSIFDVVALWIIVGLAISVGYCLGQYFGVVGWILGLPLGWVIGNAALTGLGRVLETIWPVRTPCRKGACQALDYELLRIPNEEPHFRCKCGDEYFNSLPDGRFLEVLPDGSLRPYMKRKRFGGWEPDSG